MVTVPAPDQNPDNPKNGPPEPGSACPCAEMSKSPDAITAFLRQLARGFKEKTAMNLPFQITVAVVPRSTATASQGITDAQRPDHGPGSQSPRRISFSFQKAILAGGA